MPGILPLGEMWLPECSSRLQELIESKALTAWHQNAGDSFPEDGLPVTLVDPDSEGQAFIHLVLVEEGLAIR